MSTYNCRGAINGIIVQNNPVNWVDPWGLQTHEYAGGISSDGSYYDPTAGWPDFGSLKDAEAQYHKDLKEARKARAAKAAADKCPVIPPNTGHHPYFPIDGSQDVTTGVFANDPLMFGGRGASK